MRIYAYGARPPFENAHIVEQQLRLSNSYQRALVLVEHRRRAAVDRLYQRACPDEWREMQEAEQAVEVLIGQVRSLRATKGDMLPPNEEEQRETRALSREAKEELDRARERARAARHAWYEAKKRATPKLRARLRMCDRGAYARNKAIYNRGGAVELAWGTRLKAGESVERAAQAAWKEGTLPRLPRFSGGGTVSVQLQGGLESERVICGGDTWFRIDLVDRATWHTVQGKSAFTSVKKDGRTVALPLPEPNSRKGGAGRLAIARLRVGSDGRKPVWAAWAVVMHRPLPEGKIKWAQMHVRKIGPRTEYKLLVTVDEPAVSPREEGPTLAVNLGWRNLLDGGVRVAYAVGSDGHEEEVRVPPAYVSGVSHVSSLQQIRRRMFNDAVKMLDSFVESGAQIPEWFAEATRWRDRWQSPRKLVYVLNEWERRRFDGDGRTWEVLAAWRKKDRHLWFWESDEREKLLRMRRDVYRAVAARWAQKYARVVVTDMDLCVFARRSAPEAPDRDGKHERTTQRVAAPSVLRDAIKNSCSTRGSSFEEIESKFKTQTCNACGLILAFAAKRDVDRRCECGAAWDQDANHCRNLLASATSAKKRRRALAPSAAGVSDAPGNEKRGRWQRRRSKGDVQVVDNVDKTA